MKDLKITPAPFEDALALHDSVMEALAEKEIEVSPDLFQAELDAKSIGGILKALLSVSKSTEVRNALFSCSERATYKNVKVDREFFEDLKNRPLYYPIMVEILKDNIGPFFVDLIGPLKSLAGTMTGENTR